MARIKTESKPLPPPPRSIFRVRPQAWLCALIVVVIGVGAHFLWRQTQSQIVHDPQYTLTIDNIHVTPQPPWIRSDIKTQALRDSGIVGTMSVLDDWDALSRSVKDAFEFHPWVASVAHIKRQLPSSLQVELVYRRPVAAVESVDPNGIVFLPVDDQAVRLPEGDLSEAERRYLPRITGITGRPLVGDRWGDPRVVGGAKLAAQLADVWQKLRLVEINAALQANSHDASPVYRYEMITTGGTRIVWGRTPGDESAGGESPFTQKRQRLLDYAAQHGKLETIEGPAVLDVRSDLVITPRTARHKRTKPAEEETKTK